MPTVAERAEQGQREVCAAAAQGRAAADAMNTTDTAGAYMAMALVATKARDAKAALDAIGPKNQDVAGALLQAQQIRNGCDANRVQAAIAQGASAGPVAHLDINFDPNAPADAAQGLLLLQYAQNAATASHASTEAGRRLLVDPLPPRAPGIATRALEAAQAAQRFSATACAAAAKLPTAVGALAPPPASCTDAVSYQQHLATLQAAVAGLPGSSAGVQIAGQALQATATAADASLRTCRQNFQPQHVEDLRISGLAIKGAPNMGATQNRFLADIDSAGRLLTATLLLATGNLPIVDQAIGAAPVGGGMPAAGGLTVLDRDTAALANSLAALRAALDYIEQVATAASQLIPYDPAANSTSARTALGRRDAANRGIEDLEGMQEEAARDVKDAQAEQSAAQDEQARPPKDARALKSATDKVISRQRAVQNAIDNAKAAWWGLGSIVAKCVYVPSVRTARDEFAQAQAALADVKAQPQRRVDRATADLRQALFEQARVKTALDEAKKCAVAAKAAAARAVDRRIDQLQAEGHGPQRHEGAPTPATLGERALYLIDPETHTQLDAESGELHAADLNASKIKTKEAYVNAEALARDRRAALAAVVGDPAVTVPLADIGQDIAMGVTCVARPGGSPTSLGMATTVPVVAPYVYDPNTAPPTRAQMDVPAMNAAVAAHTGPTVFAPDAEAFAVLRTDINGKVYLRTMWPQNRP